MRNVRVLATAAAVLVVVITSRAAGQSYDLITLGGSGSLRAYAVNATGQSVGVTVTDEFTHAVRWQNEVFTDLHETVHFRLKHPEIFNDDYSEAYGISDGGQIVGGAQKVIQCLNVTGDITVMHGFLLRPSVLSDFGTPVPGDALTDLSTLTNDWCANLDSAAIAISNRNHIVGWSDVNTSTAIHAFLIVPVNGQIGTVMIDLLTLDDTADPVSSASAVNDAGQITGYAYTSHAAGGETGFHAFLITPTDTNADGVGDTWVTTSVSPNINDLMQDLGTLGGTNSWGRDINNLGQVVGESDANVDGKHVTHAFLWQNGGMVDLGTLGGDNSSAASINDHGDIVGWSEDANGHRHAFIYSAGKMEDLNAKLVMYDPNGDPIAQTVLLAEARSINNDGFVIGWGTAPTDPSGPTNGFMLHPTAAVAPPVQPTNPADGSSDATAGPGTGGVPVGGTWQTPLDGTTAGTVVEGQTDSGTTTPSSSTGFCGAGATSFLPLTMGVLLLQRRRR